MTEREDYGRRQLTDGSVVVVVVDAGFMDDCCCSFAGSTAGLVSGGVSTWDGVWTWTGLGDTIADIITRSLRRRRELRIVEDGAVKALVEEREQDWFGARC